MEDETLKEILQEIRSIKVALQTPHDTLLTLSEAARLSGIAEGTLRNLISRGVVTKGIMKIGQQIRVDWRQFLSGLDRSKWVQKKRNDRRMGRSRVRS